MSAFDFNLQKVLNVRNIQEDIAQNKFLKARQKKKSMENELSKLNETKKNTYEFIRKELDSSIDMTLQARRFLYLHKQKIENHKEKLFLQEKEVTKKQQEMIEKQKKRKVLDKLKEKKYKNFYNEHLKNEQKLLDEIGQRAEIEERR